jgi:hypothetical protein
MELQKAQFKNIVGAIKEAHRLDMKYKVVFYILERYNQYEILCADDVAGDKTLWPYIIYTTEIPIGVAVK